MAASQARFLGLTARKTNTEYEGQQINQQRTCLANQSANYYNQLLGMTVPTPPSTSDYTKTVYTFQDGNLANSITALIAQPDGEYLVSYVSSWVDEFTPVSAGSAIITESVIANGVPSDFAPTGTVFDNTQPVNVGNVWTIRDFTDPTIIYAENLIQLGTTTTLQTQDGKTQYIRSAGTTPGSYQYIEQRATTMTDGDGIVHDYATVNGVNYIHNIGNTELRLIGHIPTGFENRDEYLKTLSEDQITKLLAEEVQYKAMLDEQYGQQDWYIRYVKNTTTNTYEPMFYKKSIVDEAIYSDTGTSQSNIQAFRMGSAQRTEEIKGVKAQLEKDTTGRYIKITLNCDDPTKAVTYALTTNTSTDQNAYDDAMNQYEYDKYQYDQSIKEINAKIEIIQAQDKNLELRLKQLDTERNAIQNEMEAVQKVIQKNTEDSFKTFNA